MCLASCRRPVSSQQSVCVADARFLFCRAALGHRWCVLVLSFGFCLLVCSPTPECRFWVFIVGPKIGAPLGALAYDTLIAPGLDQ